MPSNTGFKTGIDVFLDSCSKYPKLSNEDINKLCLKGDKKSLNKVVKSNLKLCVHFAKKFQRVAPLDDLVQEAAIGLMKAAEKYDPTKGFRFSTYAAFWCRSHIFAHLRKDKLIKLSTTALKKLKELNKVMIDYEEKHGKEPHYEEIAKIMGIPVKKVCEMIEWKKEVASFDDILSDDYETYFDSISGDDDEYDEYR